MNKELYLNFLELCAQIRVAIGEYWPDSIKLINFHFCSKPGFINSRHFFILKIKNPVYEERDYDFNYEIYDNETELNKEISSLYNHNSHVKYQKFYVVSYLEFYNLIKDFTPPVNDIVQNIIENTLERACLTGILR